MNGLLKWTLDRQNIDHPLQPDEFCGGLLECQQGKKLPVVLLSTGSYNPVHRLHIQILVAAKQELEKHSNCKVLHGLLSPSHDCYVKGKVGNGYLSASDRIKCLELALQEEGEDLNWIKVDKWECSQTEFVNFDAVAVHLRASYIQRMNRVLDAGTNKSLRSWLSKFMVVFVCGADVAFKMRLFCGLGPTIGVAIVDRPEYTQKLKQRMKDHEDALRKMAKHSNGHWKGMTAHGPVVFASCPQEGVYSSTRIREIVRGGKSEDSIAKELEPLTYPSVVRYLQDKSLLARLRL